jgi:hypothetical protein
MALISKMRNDKWRLAIDSEELEFPDLKTYTEIHNILIGIKDKYGRLPENQRNTR